MRIRKKKIGGKLVFGDRLYEICLFRRRGEKGRVMRSGWRGKEYGREMERNEEGEEESGRMVGGEDGVAVMRRVLCVFECDDLVRTVNSIDPF
jgi:hypothetical protein